MIEDNGNLNPTCQIRRESDGIFRDKGNGTAVFYHLFPEYEIHANVIEGGTVQEWHHHLKITETLFILSGELEARWIDGGGGEISTATLHKGDLVDVGATVHTFANMTTAPCEFVVFRFVPDGEDKREMIKADRYADTVV